MAQPLTTNHLKSLHDAIRAEMRQNTKDIISDQRQSLQPIRGELQEANTKLDAIMSGEVLVTRKQLERVLRALKARGIELDEHEIFAA